MKRNTITGKELSAMTKPERRARRRQGLESSRHQKRAMKRWKLIEKANS